MKNRNAKELHYQVPPRLVEAYRRLSPDDLASCTDVQPDSFTACDPDDLEYILRALDAEDAAIREEVAR